MKLNNSLQLTGTLTDHVNNWLMHILYVMYVYKWKICENCKRFFYCHRDLLETAVHGEMISIIGHFKCILYTWAHHNSSKRWLQNYYSGTICTVVNFMQLWLNTASSHLFTFLLNSNGTMYTCFCVHKFW